MCWSPGAAVGWLSTFQCCFGACAASGASFQQVAEQKLMALPCANWTFGIQIVKIAKHIYIWISCISDIGMPRFPPISKYIVVFIKGPRVHIYIIIYIYIVCIVVFFAPKCLGSQTNLDQVALEKPTRDFGGPAGRSHHCPPVRIFRCFNKSFKHLCFSWGLIWFNMILYESIWYLMSGSSLGHRLTE